MIIIIINIIKRMVLNCYTNNKRKIKLSKHMMMIIVMIVMIIVMMIIVMIIVMMMMMIIVIKHIMMRVIIKHMTVQQLLSSPAPAARPRPPAHRSDVVFPRVRYVHW